MIINGEEQMNYLDKLLGKIADRCFPTQDEETKVRATVTDLMGKILTLIENSSHKNIEIEPMVVGSAAKGTYLKEADIDLFLLFEQDVPEDITTSICMELGKKALDTWVIKYASHPYISGKYRGMGVDIVWAYRVSSGEKIVSAVDRTPFHTNYINENLNSSQKREVLLLKQYLKGIGIYSASLKVEGLSGYLAELLIVKFGSFRRTLEEVASWGRQTIIVLGDPSTKRGANNSGLGKKFHLNNLIFLDPVDQKRNVASALSRKNYFRFVAASREFLSRPTENFFLPSPLPQIDIEEIKKMMEERGSILLSIEIGRPDVVDDVLYSQIHKSLDSLKTTLERCGFIVFGMECAVDNQKDLSGTPEGCIWFVMEIDRKILPAGLVHVGPPITNVNTEKFVDKWMHADRSLSLPYIEKGRWKVIIKREHVHVEEIMDSAMPTLKLGKNLDEQVEKGNFIILSGDAVIEKRWCQDIYRLLVKGEPWHLHKEK